MGYKYKRKNKTKGKKHMTIFEDNNQIDDFLKPYDIDKPLTKLETAILKQLNIANLDVANIPQIEQYANKAYQQQDYLTAKTAFELMLKTCIYQGIVDKDNFDILDALTGIALCLSELGNLQQALPYYQFIYETRKQAYGEQEIDTINSLEAFAICLSQLGKFKISLPFYQQIADFRQLRLGTENQDTLGSINNLANCLLDLGELHKAYPLFLQVYKTRKKLFGNNHVDMIQSCNSLARCLFHLGRISESLPLWQQAYDNYQNLFGIEHPDTLNCLNNLAACMDELGKHQQALKLHQQIYKTNLKLLGLQHPDTLYNLDNLAVCYSKLKQPETALPLFEQAYQNRLTVLGSQHHETLNSLHNLGSCLYKLGDFDLAGLKYQQAYEIRKTVLGEQHLDTLMSLYLFITCQNDDDDNTVNLLKHLSNLLISTPMQYGKWTYITAQLAHKIGIIVPFIDTDWIKILRRLSKAFIAALDLQPESFLKEARQNFMFFHSCYLEICLSEPHHEVIPEILAAIQGRKIAAIFLDELQQQSMQLTGLQRFSEIQSKLRQQALISNRNLEDYQDLFDEYYLQRLELAKNSAFAFMNPIVDLKQLQFGLTSHEAILLLIDLTSLDIKLFNVFEQIAVLITPNNFYLIPLDVSHLVNLILTPNFDASSLDEKVTNFIWQPLLYKLINVKVLHVITHGKLHLLPYELGQPRGIKIYNYPGLVFYQQLHHYQKSSRQYVKPCADALLGIQVDAAENQEYPIPLVKAEKQMIEVVWKDAVVPNANIELVDFLHLAGHGFQDLDNPADAQLLISSDNYLNLQVILSSNFRPRVVFLSACVVGRISEDIDGSPLGLVSAFLLRGAEYVIASLVPVPDFYMPLLALLFHQAWQRGCNPDIALVEAKRRLKSGVWYEDTEVLVYDSYYPVLIKFFGQIARSRDRKIWQALQKSWPIPVKYHRHGSAKINNLLRKLRDNDFCNQLVEDVLYYVFRHKGDLVLGDFYNWVRGFGWVDG